MPTRLNPAPFLPLKTDVLYVLLSIESQVLHGYAIIQDVADRSAGGLRLQAGAFYRMLRRLLIDGLIEECARPPADTSTDERRRYYRATRLGRAVVQAELERLARLVETARAQRSRGLA